MSELELDDATLYYEEHGTGEETILFSHGLLLDHRQYDAQIEHFSDDYRCIVWDHRGQGRSSVPDTPWIDMETLYLDALALIEELEAVPCHVVGLSMGGFVGLRLAARRPDYVESLTLMDTRAGPEDDDNIFEYRILNGLARWIGIQWVVDRVMPILFGETFMRAEGMRERRERWRRRIASRDHSIYKAVEGVIYRPGIQRELGTIEAPTLVLHGEEDEVIPPRIGRRLARRLPDATFELIPAAGHCSSIEQPEIVNDALEAFLESH
jgi:pimeloyl-ACP methyl ester carboxylesterase